MAASSKIGSYPLRALMAAAVTAIALAMAVPAGVANGQDQGIDRGIIPMAPDAPSRYVVVPGDTLWDISAKFLTDPWYWPEIWHVNPQVANPHLIYPGDELALTWVDGRPQVTLASSGNVRLSPRVRVNPLDGAVLAIPYDRIAAFMSRPAVLSRDQVNGAPYVASARDERLISSVGNDIYVRRLEGGVVGHRYSIYHVGDELRDPDDGDVLGYQGVFAGEGDVNRLGDPATVRVTDSARETLEGDILLPIVGDPKMDFVPRAPGDEDRRNDHVGRRRSHDGRRLRHRDHQPRRARRPRARPRARSLGSGRGSPRHDPEPREPSSSRRPMSAMASR